MPSIETIWLCLLFLSPVNFRFIQEEEFRSEEKYRVIRNNCRGFNNLPPRSPDATPCDFFLWGYVMDQVYVPPFPASIPEL